MKKKFKFILDEFIYGGHLSALVALTIAWSLIILLNNKTEWKILIISFLTFQIIYAYNYFEEIKIDSITNPERVEHLQKIKKYFPLIILFYLFILTIFISLLANLNILFLAVFLIISGVLYVKFFKGFTEKIVSFKNFYVSFFWTAGVSFFVLFCYSFSFDFFFFLLFLFIFFRILINTIFFDIKDIESDKTKNLKTIPVVFGKNTTLNILNLLNFFSFLPLIIGVYLKIIPIFSLFLLIFFFYDYYYIKKAEMKNSKNIRFISYLMADSEYIFWPFILIVGKIFIG